MERELFRTARKAVKHWWLSLLIGLLAVIVGIWCMTTPDTTLVALAILFTVSFLVGGALEIIFAISNRQNLDGWGFTLAAGIIDLIFGILLIVIPMGATTMFMIYFVGFWILFRSIWAIGVAIDLHRFKVKDWGWFLAFAILGMLFSFAFVISPGFGAGVIIVLVSVAFICYGIFRIFLAFRLKSWNKDLGIMEKKIKEIKDAFE